MQKIFKVFTVFIAIIPLCGAFSFPWYFFDLLRNFLPHAMWVLVILHFAWMAARQKRWVIGSGAMVILAAVGLSGSIQGQRPDHSSNSEAVRVMSFNLSSGNKEVRPVLEELRRQNLDLIGLIEVNDVWADEIAKAFPDYDKILIGPKIGNFGMALLSRTRILRHRIRFEEIAGVPSIEAQLPILGQTVTVVLTHPYPPLHPTLFDQRNRQLQAIANAYRNHQEPLWIMGDLNTVPWSPHFRKLQRDLHLQDSRVGMGYQGSWPSFLPVGKIPIDHLLLGGNYRVISRQIGLSMGSDHHSVKLLIALDHP